MSEEPLTEVVLTKDTISCTRPNGDIEQVRFDDLLRVEVMTTDAGPAVTDVYFILADSEGECVIPMGSAGDEHLLEKLQTLPGFDNETYIQAMSSTEDARFLCWQKA
jgi:hypothetical protein